VLLLLLVLLVVLFVGAADAIRNSALVGALGSAFSAGPVGALAGGIYGGFVVGVANLIVGPNTELLDKKPMFIIYKYFAPCVAAQKAKEAVYRWNGKDTADALASMKEAQATDQAAMESLTDFFEQLPRNLNDVNVLPSFNANSAASAAAAMEEEPASAPSAAIANVEENGGGNAGDQPNRVMSVGDVRNILISQINQRIAFRNGLIVTLENKIAKLDGAIVRANQAAQQKATSPWASHARF